MPKRRIHFVILLNDASKTFEKLKMSVVVLLKVIQQHQNRGFPEMMSCLFLRHCKTDKNFFKDF